MTFQEFNGLLHSTGLSYNTLKCWMSPAMKVELFSHEPIVSSNFNMLKAIHTGVVNRLLGVIILQKKPNIVQLNNVLYDSDDLLLWYEEEVGV